MAQRFPIRPWQAVGWYTVKYPYVRSGWVVRWRNDFPYVRCRQGSKVAHTFPIHCRQERGTPPFTRNKTQCFTSKVWVHNNSRKAWPHLVFIQQRQIARTINALLALETAAVGCHWGRAIHAYCRGQHASLCLTGRVEGSWCKRASVSAPEGWVS